MAQALYRLYNGTDRQRIRFSSKIVAVAKKDAWRRNKRLRWITDGKNCRMVDKDSAVPDGWRFGYIQENYWDSHMWITDGVKDDIVEKGSPVPDGWRIGRSKGKAVSGKIWITDGVNDEYVERGSIFPSGWRKGRSASSVAGKKSTRSKRAVRYLLDGQMMTVEEIAEKLDMPTAAVYVHIRKGHAVDSIRRRYDEFHAPSIEYHGKLYTITDLESLSGISRKTIRKYLKLGYSVDSILDNYVKGKTLKKIFKEMKG
jgi:predicted transcriptional regulator